MTKPLALTRAQRCSSNAYCNECVNSGFRIFFIAGWSNIHAAAIRDAIAPTIPACRRYWLSIGNGVCVKAYPRLQMGKYTVNVPGILCELPHSVHMEPAYGSP